MWPFNKPTENRASSGGFTDLIPPIPIGQSRGHLSWVRHRAWRRSKHPPDSIASAFQSAEVDGDTSGLITAPLLGHIAQELIRRGQSLLEIRRDRLIPCGYWYWTGSADPATWAALITNDGPTDQESRVLLNEDLVFCRYSFDRQVSLDRRRPAAGCASHRHPGGEAWRRPLPMSPGRSVAMVVPFPERSLWPNPMIRKLTRWQR